MNGKVTLWTCSRCGQLNSKLDVMKMNAFICDSCHNISNRIEKF